MPDPITVVDIKKFLETGASRPVQMSEMQEFWKSLTDDEKNDYRNSVAKWDKKSEFVQ